MPPVALHFSVFTGASCSLGHILVFVFLSAPVASCLWMQSAAPWFGLHALSVSLGFSPFTRLSQQALQALLISSSICIRRWFFFPAQEKLFSPLTACCHSLVWSFLVYYQIYQFPYLETELHFSVGVFCMCVHLCDLAPCLPLWKKNLTFSSWLISSTWFLSFSSLTSSFITSGISCTISNTVDFIWTIVLHIFMQCIAKESLCTWSHCILLLLVCLSLFFRPFSVRHSHLL